MVQYLKTTLYFRHFVPTKAQSPHLPLLSKQVPVMNPIFLGLVTVVAFIWTIETLFPGFKGKPFPKFLFSKPPAPKKKEGAEAFAEALSKYLSDGVTVKIKDK